MHVTMLWPLNIFIYLFIYIYILGVFTEKPYSKPLECNVVYIAIITLSQATSHDFKWRQNKPWLSTIWWVQSTKYAWALAPPFSGRVFTLH